MVRTRNGYGAWQVPRYNVLLSGPAFAVDWAGSLSNPAQHSSQLGDVIPDAISGISPIGGTTAFTVILATVAL